MAASPGGASIVQDVQALIQKVDHRYAQTRDLQADFAQETQIEGFESRLISSGRVLLKKPGLLRWDYVDPSVEHIFVDGDRVFVYVPEHKQVIKATLTQLAASKAPLVLLQGAGKLAEQFDVRPPGELDKTLSDSPLVTLVPKPGDRATSPITRIVLEIDPESYLIKTIRLHEMSGNISTLHFRNIRVNQGIPAALLELELPDDVVTVDAPFPQE